VHIPKQKSNVVSATNKISVVKESFILKPTFVPPLFTISHVGKIPRPFHKLVYVDGVGPIAVVVRPLVEKLESAFG